MACVYLIQNLFNANSYVGVTSGTIEYRWKKHLVCSRSSRKSKLYSGIRKYGAVGFTISQIAEFDDLRDAFLHEELMIRILDTRQNGYNHAHGGDAGVRKEIEIQGTLFRSHAAAAKAHKVPYAVFMDRLQKGRTPEQAAGLTKYIRFNGTVSAEGVEYPTLNAAAVAYGLDRTNVHKRVMNLGWTTDEALGIVKRDSKRGVYKRKRKNGIS